MFSETNRRRSAALAVWLLISLSGCSTLPKPEGDTAPPRPEVPSEQALAHFGQGMLHEMDRDLEAANESYLKALEYDPDRTELYVRTAFNFLRLREVEKARAVMEKLVDRHPRDPVSYVWLAKLHLNTQDPEAAEDAYRKALKADPSFAQAYLELTGLLMATSRDAEAVDLLETALKKVENPAELLSQLGILYMRKASLVSGAEEEAELRRQAIGMYQRAVKEDPTNPDLLYQLGDLYVLDEDMARAAEVFTKLVRLKPEEVPARQKLALALIATGDQEKAVDVLEHVVHQDPTNSKVYFYLGELYQQLGDTTNAVLNYELAVKAGDPPQAAAFVKLALLQIEEENPEAEETLKSAIEKIPGDVRLHEMLAYYYLNQKEPVKALPVFAETERLIEVEGGAPQPNFYLYYALAAQHAGDLSTSAGKLLAAVDESPEFLDAFAQFTFQDPDREHRAQAGKVLRKLADRMENPLTALTYIGLLHNQDEEYREAVELFREIEETAAERRANDEPAELRPAFYFWYGAAAERIKDFEKAEELFEKCIELDPEHAEAYNYLAYMWAEQAINLDQAKRYIAKALEMDPDNGAFLDTLGWIYYQLGDYQIAYRYVEEAADLIPDDPTITEHLGDIAEKQGRMEDAVDKWRKALTLQPDNETLRGKLENAGATDLPPPPENSENEPESAPAPAPSEPNPDPAATDMDTDGESDAGFPDESEFDLPDQI